MLRAIYDGIMALLPYKITITIDSSPITGSKYFIDGLLTGISILELEYDIMLILSDTYKFSIDSDFGYDNSYMPYSVELPGPDGGVFTNFNGSMDFLSGLKKTYESNKIPFNITSYYDNATGREINIQ